MATPLSSAELKAQQTIKTAERALIYRLKHDIATFHTLLWDEVRILHLLDRIPKLHDQLTDAQRDELQNYNNDWSPLSAAERILIRYEPCHLSKDSTHPVKLKSIPSSVPNRPPPPRAPRHSIGPRRSHLWQILPEDKQEERVYLRRTEQRMSYPEVLTAAPRVLIRVLQKNLKTFYQLNSEEAFLLNYTNRFPTLAQELTSDTRRRLIALVQDPRFQPTTTAYAILHNYRCIDDQPIGDETTPIDLLTIPFSTIAKRKSQRKFIKGKIDNLPTEPIYYDAMAPILKTDMWPHAGGNITKNQPSEQSGANPLMTWNVVDKNGDPIKFKKNWTHRLAAAPFKQEIADIMDAEVGSGRFDIEKIWDSIQSIPVLFRYQHLSSWVAPMYPPSLMEVAKHFPQAYIWTMCERIHNDLDIPITLLDGPRPPQTTESTSLLMDVFLSWASFSMAHFNETIAVISMVMSVTGTGTRPYTE